MENTKFLDLLNEASDFEGKFLENLRISSREKGIPVMLKEGAKYLAMTVAQNSPKNILEIGTAVGYSGSLMLKYADSDAFLTTIEIDEKSVEVAKANFLEQGLLQKVRIFEGDAEDIVPLMSGTFDFVLIDGPKSRYLEFYPYVKKMLKVGGILFCDNVLFRDFVSGEKKNPHRMQTIVNNMRSFLEVIAKDEDFITNVLDIGDGICVSVKLRG